MWQLLVEPKQKEDVKKTRKGGTTYSYRALHKGDNSAAKFWEEMKM